LENTGLKGIVCDKRTQSWLQKSFVRTQKLIGPHIYPEGLERGKLA